MVVPYGPGWPRRYQVEAKLVRGILGRELMAIRHIGSTAVVGLNAKPIINLLAAVQDIGRVDGFNAAFVKAGYQARGEYGIPGRRFFIKGSEEERLCHLHIFQAGSPQIARHLRFRDYLRTHPEEARAYGGLKLRLAREFPTDIEAYMTGKDGFINGLDRRAEAWAKESHPRAVYHKDP